MSPKISIIIPAHNTEAYITQAIQSVLSQTFQDFEIVVIDDASTDATYRVVKAIQDPRINLVRSAVNLGAGGARNLALKLAKGDWVAVLDSDDWFAPDRLETFLKIAETTKADIIADDLHLVNDGTHEPWSTLMQWSGQSFHDLFYIDATFFVLDNVEGEAGMCFGYSKPMFRRSFLVEHQIQYLTHIKIAEDFWFDMDCLIRGANFVVIPEPYYYYRTRQGALTTSVKRIFRLSQECEAIRMFAEKHSERLKSQPQLRQALEYKCKQTRKHLDYYKVIEPLKEKKIYQSILALPHSPGFITCLFSRIPEILERRFQSIFLKKSTVYEKFSH